MRANVSFTPKCNLLRIYMPNIKIGIVDVVKYKERFEGSLVIQYPRRSLGLRIEIRGNKSRMRVNFVTDFSGKIQNIAPERLLDQVFGVPKEDMQELLNSLVTEIFEHTKLYNGYDITKDMAAILTWEEKTSKLPV